MLNERFELRDSGCSNSVESEKAPRHRWYLIKEAFSPRIVEAAIKSAAGNRISRLIDPFCGSGTVPLVAAQRGLSSIGFEVNPFLAFVAKAKLARARHTTLARHESSILRAVETGAPSPLEKFSTFSEAGGARQWLFNAPVLRSFEGGWRATTKTHGAVRSLFRLALLGAAMDTCNAVRDGKCLRYRPERLAKLFSRDDFLKALRTRLGVMREDLENSPIRSTDGEIDIGDCRRTLRHLRRRKFQLCVTSPPYLNSFDYSDVYRPELFLGKFVCDNDSLMTVRLRTFRSHVQAKWDVPSTSAFGPLYNGVIELLRGRADLLWNKRLLLMVQAYFEDMQTVLRRLLLGACDGAVLWIVVSTSAYAGVEIPVDLIIADVGVRLGWRLREVGVLRDLRTAGQHWAKWGGPGDRKPVLRESVVILERGAGGR